jgi:membrane protein implicated in regulation of membrane protease activity
MEYGEYIKFIIFALLAIVFIYVMAKWFIKRRKKLGLED